MIIVAGHLRVEPAHRDQYLDSCKDVVAQARAAAGCLDFSLAAEGSEFSCDHAQQL